MPEVSLLKDRLLASIPVHEGYKVLGAIVICRKLGEGRLGAVYRGWHLRHGVDVAVKIVPTPEWADGTQAGRFTQRFVRLARTAAGVKHQNLVQVLDVNTEHGVCYVAMEHIDGESAAERLTRKGRLAEEEVVDICLGAAEGLGQAHRRGIVHADVKPANIRISRTGQVLVTDLGLARAYRSGQDDEVVTMGHGTGPQSLGTPGFMSPEMFMPTQEPGPPADVWSLGVTFYYLLTGKMPWTADYALGLAKSIRSAPLRNPKEFRPGLSDGVCATIEKALEKDANRRYSNCGEMATALLVDSIGKLGESSLADATAGAGMTAPADSGLPSLDTLALIATAIQGEQPGEKVPIKMLVQKRRPVSMRAFVALVALAFLVGATGAGWYHMVWTPQQAALKASKADEERAMADIETRRKADEERRRVEARRQRAEETALSRERAERRKAEERAATLKRVESTLFEARRLSEAGSLAEARDRIAEALAVLPDHEEAKRLHADLVAAIRIEQIRAESEKEARERAQTYESWMAAAAALRKLGNFEEAAQAYEKAAEHAPPGSKEAAYAAEHCHREHQEAQALEAERILEAQKAEEARRAEAARLLAAAEEAELAGDLDGALARCREAAGHVPEPGDGTARHPADAKLAGQLAALEERVARRRAEAEAAAGYAGAMESARARIQSKAWEEAALLLGRALGYKPGDAEATRLLTEAKRHLGPARDLTIDLGGGVTLGLVYVAPGRFTMGSDVGADDEKPAHEVTISNGFYLGRYEVTRGQFAAFVRATGHETEAEKQGGAWVWSDGQWRRQEGASWKSPGFVQTDDHPVVCVSADEAAAFCRWASRMSGLPCRMPTEAEWEYAARAGSTGSYYFGGGERELGANAWYRDNSGMQTHPVGRKRPNRWGFCDMYGNVREWCADWYDSGYYRKSPRENPTGAASGTSRTLRGGSCDDYAYDCRSSSRSFRSPVFRQHYDGFRIAADPMRR